MANLKEIRNRIGSIKSTMQITSAMKMVSASKLKKAQDAIIAMRPYSSKLTELLQNLSTTLDGEIGDVLFFAVTCAFVFEDFVACITFVLFVDCFLLFGLKSVNKFN